jgi:hypothetical protein
MKDFNFSSPSYGCSSPIIQLTEVNAIVSYVTGQFSDLKSAAIAHGISEQSMISAMTDDDIMALVDVRLDIENLEGRSVELSALNSLNVAVEEVAKLVSDPQCPATALVQAAQFLYRVAGIEQKRGYENKERLATAGVLDGANFSINIIFPEDQGGARVVPSI